MEPQFFQTHMGKKYYDYDFPELVRQLKRLNENLEKQPVPADKKIYTRKNIRAYNEEFHVGSGLSGKDLYTLDETETEDFEKFVKGQQQG